MLSPFVCPPNSLSGRYTFPVESPGTCHGIGTDAESAGFDRVSKISIPLSVSSFPHWCADPDVWGLVVLTET